MALMLFQRRRRGASSWVERRAAARDWFTGDSGKRFLQCQNAYFSRLLAEYPGQRILLLSLIPDALSEPESPFRHVFRLWPASEEMAVGGKGFIANIEELPFEDGSLDLVIVHHSLEYANHAQQALKEAARVTAAAGYLMVVSHNPVSVSGVYALLLSWFRPKSVRARRSLMAYRINDWLKFLDFTPLKCQYLCHLMFFRRRRLFNLMSLCQRLLIRMNFPFSPVYCLVARKDVNNLRLIQLSWKTMLFKGALGAARPAQVVRCEKPTKRNSS